jgi:two-component system, LytTR family, response regulator
MDTIEVLVIESNKKEAQKLSDLLEEHIPQANVRGVAHTVKDAVNKIDRIHPDLVFLNANIPGNDGQLLYDVLKDLQVDIVFTSVNDGNAIETINRTPVDCITGSLDEKMVKTAIMRFYEKHKLQSLSQRFLHSMEAASSNPRIFNKIVIPEAKGFTFVKIGDIVFVEAEGNYSKIQLVAGHNLIATRTLKYFEKLLPRATFYRTHKSYLINLNLINRIVRNDGLKVIMEGGVEVDIADRSRKDFLERVMQGSSAEPPETSHTNGKNGNGNGKNGNGNGNGNHKNGNGKTVSKTAAKPKSKTSSRK